MNYQRPILFVCCLLLLSTAALKAQEYDDTPFFDFNQKMRDAHANALRLRVKDCKVALQLEKSQNRYNIIPYYVDDLADFMQTLASENHDEFKRFQQQRLVRLSRIRTGDRSSPYYLFTVAALQLHAAYHHVVFYEPNDAKNALKSAMADIERNMKSFPDFMGNRMLYGVAQILSECAGARTGSSNLAVEGLTHLKDVLAYGKSYPKFEFNEDAQMWYGLMLILLHSEDEKDWALLNPAVLDYKRSPTAAYIFAMQQWRTGQSTKMYATLTGTPSSDQYNSLHYLQFLLGIHHLCKLEPKAETHFRNYLARSRGEHHQKNALLRIAHCQLINKNTAGYATTMRDLLLRGNTVEPFDYFAEEEALRKYTPDYNLVRAKLYLEGGYHDKARIEINQAQSAHPYDQAEILYVKARIHHKAKTSDAALSAYTELINQPAHKNKYVTAFAQYYAAQIWAERGDKVRATTQLNTLLKANFDALKSVVHLRARLLLDALSNNATASNMVRRGSVIGGANK